MSIKAGFKSTHSSVTFLALIMLFASCQMLEKRELQLSNTFCTKCEEPLRKILLDNESIHAVKYNKGKVFFYYDQSKLNIDSLDNMLMRRGFLPHKDSIIMYPVCCSKKSVFRSDSMSSVQ